MKIVTIDWEKKIIEELETDRIEYHEDGIYCSVRASNNLMFRKRIPYENFLGAKEIN
jgi:hypothetical protein